MPKKSNSSKELKEKLEFLKVQEKYDKAKHQRYMEALKFQRESERIHHENEKERQRIKTAEIRKSQMYKESMGWNK